MPAGATKFGAEFLVNTSTTSSQFQSTVAGLANGKFIVVWSDGSAGDVNVRGQVFNADGTKFGVEFLVNTTTVNAQLNPSIAALQDGGFIVVFEDFSVPGVEIRSQAFNADGTLRGAELLVTPGNHPTVTPEATTLANGNSVVVWRDFSSLSDATHLPHHDLHAQIIASDGSLVGTEFVVAEYMAIGASEPAIAGLLDGEFVVAWNDGFDIVAQRFDPAGNPLGTQLTVTTGATTGTQRDPAVAALSDGRFVVSWTDPNQLNDEEFGSTIRAKLFNADGSLVGIHFGVNTLQLQDQSESRLTTLPDGRFIAVWTDASQAGGEVGTAIHAQVFGSDGSKSGTVFFVNATTFLGQDDPSITVFADGRFAITWTDQSQSPDDPSFAAVRGQIFDPRIAAVDLTGTSLGDDWVGTSFDDTMRGASGNDRMDGGGGTDTAVFSAARSAYIIGSIGSDFQVTGPAGTDALKNFEFAQFADTTVALVPTVTGTSGNDSFTALPGSELIEGLGGVDTITFNFALIDAMISWSGNRVIVDTASSHTELTGFETFVFTDGTVNDADGNPLVDDLFYYARNHDVWNAHIDAELHYGVSGRHEGRDPNAFFDLSFYRSIYPDVGGADPLAQFDMLGWQLGRTPSLAFDSAKYLAANPDVAAAHVDPLRHFLTVGASEGRQPFALTQLLTPSGFDYVYYLQHNPDVAAAGIDPLQHFQAVGWTEGRDPNALFDTAGYLANYTDVAAVHINPLDHYNAIGWLEDRDPSLAFDTSAYLAANPDVAAAQVNPLLHFLQFGQNEGRTAFADGTWG
jgi:hypothetical protein